MSIAPNQHVKIVQSEMSFGKQLKEVQEQRFEVSVPVAVLDLDNNSVSSGEEGIDAQEYLAKIQNNFEGNNMFEILVQTLNNNFNFKLKEISNVDDLTNQLVNEIKTLKNDYEQKLVTIQKNCKE